MKNIFFYGNITMEKKRDDEKNLSFSEGFLDKKGKEKRKKTNYLLVSNRVRYTRFRILDLVRYLPLAISLISDQRAYI
jgi:hypothetical protein